MTRQSVVEWAEAVRARYRIAGRAEKQRILDEFCEATGMHRKAAIRLLNREEAVVTERRGRPRQYGPEVTEALVKVWEVGDRMCSKLLVAVMPDLVGALERHGEMKVGAEVRAQLMAVSASTIDRLLRRHRRGLGLQPRRVSSPAGSLKGEIPIRTWSEWKGTEVGSLQADLVLHCGESTEGFYLTTLCAIDVATGWTELQPVWGHGQQRVGTAVHHVRQRLPFPIPTTEARRLDRDRGLEALGEDREERREERAKLERPRHRSGDGGFAVDQVVVPAPVTFAFDVAGTFEVGDDALDGALANANAASEVLETDVRLAGDAEQDVGVVGEEVPLGHSVTETTPIRPLRTSGEPPRGKACLPRWGRQSRRPRGQVPGPRWRRRGVRRGVRPERGRIP